MNFQKPEEILKKYWGFDSFRPLQKEIITSVLSGEDIMAILPTGAGKSICYQIPALALGGVCLVISPLIALMQDQVVNLRKVGVSAACIHSAMPQGAVNDMLNHALSGNFQILYVAPERLQAASFIKVLSEIDIRLVVVDEAHCIAQWGHDFRPAYLNIAKIKTIISPKTRWMALTATATEKVRAEILHYLKIENARVFRQGVYRPNLVYRVLRSEAKLTDIIRLFRACPGSGILYCPTRKRCMEMRQWFQMNNMKALAYHAGLPKEDRFAIQKQWMQASDTVICATSAFGMGIDKEDVKLVVHLSPPESLEAYYQEAGRAGRNGLSANCILLYDSVDLSNLKELPSVQYPPKKFVLQVYQFVGDYLKIALGAGAGTPLPFDVVQFAGKFDLELLPCMSAIRILEQSGILVWERQEQIPSTVQITADREELQSLQQIRPELHEIVTALLRLHSGIFSYPVSLKIWDTAKYLQLEQKVVELGLKQLHAMGILIFRMSAEGGFLTFQEDRCRPAELALDEERIKRLKQALEQRIRKMLAYLENTWECRSRLLAEYFGEKATAKCNQCDNCRTDQKILIKPYELNKQLRAILSGSSETALQTLSLHFPGIPEDSLIQQLRNLQAEGFCRVLSNGTIITQ